MFDDDDGGGAAAPGMARNPSAVVIGWRGNVAVTFSAAGAGDFARIPPAAGAGDFDRPVTPPAAAAAVVVVVVVDTDIEGLLLLVVPRSLSSCFCASGLPNVADKLYNSIAFC